MLNPNALFFSDANCSPANDANLSEMFNGNMFTDAAYLRAQGHCDFVMSDGPGLTPVLLSRQPSHLLYLDRLQTLSLSEIDAHSAQLFDKAHLDFIVFEDVRLDPDIASMRHCHQRFGYKANWRRVISAGDRLLSNKQASNLRRKQKKLHAALGGSETEFRFARTVPGDVAQIVEMNRIKIKSGGGRHHMTDEKLAAMEALCARIGYTAKLTHEGKLLAGNILCVSGNRSFIPVLGHDLTYEKFSIGMQVTLLALSELERMGCTECNFLWGDSRWKSDFKADREVLETVVVRRNNRVLFSPDYWGVVLPYAREAAKTVIRPHFKKMTGMVPAGWLPHRARR